MGEKVDGWLITANVRTTVYSLVVARTGGVGRLSLLGCHLRTSAKHRSFAAYRVRAWPGADARWQAPPQAKLARSRGRGPRHSVVQFGAKLVRRRRDDGEAVHLFLWDRYGLKSRTTRSF